MSNHKWHSGPPPHVGWWLASTGKWMDAWRWWDGESWSVVVTDRERDNWAAQEAERKSSYKTPIFWSDYYPENARVPRLKP